MKASDLVKGDSERNAAESSLLHTETTDAVNAGLVGSADKSKKMLKENGFEYVSRKSSSDSPESLVTSKNADVEDVLKDSGAEVGDLVVGSDGTDGKGASKGSEAAAAAGKGTSSRLSRGTRFARKAAVAGAAHKTLEGSELEGVDDAYYKGKGGYRLGRKAVDNYRKRRQTQAEKRAVDSVGEKKYRQQKSSETVQREMQNKRNQMTSRAIQAEKTAHSASLATTTSSTAAITSSAGGGVKIAAATSAGGGGVLTAACGCLLPILGGLLIMVLLTAIIGAIVGTDDDDTGSLSTVELSIVYYLRDLGYTDEAIAAVLGNVAAESLDPTDEHTAYESGSLRIVCGAFQFTSVYGSGTGNYYKFMSWCSANGFEWSEIDVQVEFLFSPDSPGYLGSSWSTGLAGSYYSNCTDYESRFGTDYYKTAALFMEADDVDLATYSFMACYERPANGTTAHLDTRLERARYYLDILEASDVSSVTDDEIRQAILTAAYYVANAYATPYVYGGSDIVNGCDCSYFTQWCYAQAGISIPRSSEAQALAGTIISISDAQPGDLLWMQGHIGIYAGGTTVIEQTPDYCRVTSLSYQDWVCAVSFG